MIAKTALILAVGLVGFKLLGIDVFSVIGATIDFLSSHQGYSFGRVPSVYH